MKRSGTTSSAAALFSAVLPMDSNLAYAAELVLEGIQDELKSVEAELVRLTTEPGTAIHYREEHRAFRMGERHSLLADQVRWQMIANAAHSGAGRPPGTGVYVSDR